MTVPASSSAPPRAEPHRFDMELVLGYVLLGGVVVSVALVAAGLAWHWLRTGQLAVEYSLGKRNLVELVLVELHQLAQGAFRPRLLISLGIVALLLTPYVRVLTALVWFVLVERNWKYSAFTALVLAVLTYSLFLR